MPKWDPKAHVGIYFGHSPTDTGSVVLVLNPGTLHVFPQFHVNAQEGESLPTSHVTDVNLDYAVAINVAPIQNFPEETNESVTTSDSVPVPIVDSDLVLDSVPGRVVDRVSVRVNDSNFKMPKLANLYGLYRRKSSRTPKPSQRAKDYDDKTVKHFFGLFFFHGLLQCLYGTLYMLIQQVNPRLFWKRPCFMQRKFICFLMAPLMP